MKSYPNTTGSARHLARRILRRPTPPSGDGLPPAAPPRAAASPALRPGDTFLLFAATDDDKPTWQIMRQIRRATFAVELRDGEMRVVKDRRPPNMRRGERVVLIMPTATDAVMNAARHEIAHATFVVRLSRDGIEHVLHDRNRCGTYVRALERADHAVMIHADGITITRNDDDRPWWAA